MAVALLVAIAVIAVSEGRIVYVEGRVDLLPAGGDAIEAIIGDPVAQGDVVITGSDGFAIIEVTGRSQVKLRADTELAISSLAGDGVVDVRRGGVFARVARAAGNVAGSTFQVTTPTVVAGVRGTEFFIAYGRTIEDLPDVWLCVNEGTVEVSVPQNGQRQLVEQGQGINILGGTEVTDPRFFEWTTDLNWNFDPGAGEVRDETDLDAAYADLLDQDYE